MMGGRNDPMGGHRGGDPGAQGWGNPPPPQRQPPGGWGGPSGAGGAGAPGSNRGAAAAPASWDLDSPSVRSRPIDDGTGVWGGKPSQPPHQPSNNSNWKDMPSVGSHSQIRGPGPPMTSGGMPGPTKDSALWPRGPRGATGGWGNDAADSQMGGGSSGYPNPNNSGWGDIESRKPDTSGGGIWPDNGPATTGWGRPPRNPVGGPNTGGGIRSSPGWGGPNEDSPLDQGNPGGWPSSVKPVGLRPPGADMSPGMMWQQSKPYRKLIEMGYNKNDVETALRQGNGTLEDALELLSNANCPRVPMSSKPEPMFGGAPGGGGGTGGNQVDSGSLYDNPRSGGSGGGRFGPGSSGNQMYGGPQDPQMLNNPGLPTNFGNATTNPMMQKVLPGMNSGTNLPPSSVPPISSTRPQQPGASQVNKLCLQFEKNNTDLVDKVINFKFFLNTRTTVRGKKNSHFSSYETLRSLPILLV